MSEKEIHELAVAFAQTKLLVSHMENKDNSCFISGSDSRDIHQFLKSYRFALDNIPTEWDDID